MKADYQMLKNRRDEERAEMEEVSPEPKALSGRIIPLAFAGWPKADIFKRQSFAATKIAMTTLVNTAEKIGWKALINTVHALQGPKVTAKAKKLGEKHGHTGGKVVDAIGIVKQWAIGCGFTRHFTTMADESYGEGYADWCPQIEALHEMGHGEQAGELHYWCDSYDRFLMRAGNEDAFYTHTHCTGCPEEGDRHCRSTLKTFDREKWDKEDPYETLKEIRVEQREYLENKEIEPRKFHTFAPEFVMDLSDLEMQKLGAKTKFGIALDIIVIAAHKLGWKAFINMIAEKQTYGFRKAAVDRKREFNVVGNSLEDASALAAMGYIGWFDTHQIVDFKPDRIEGCGQTCPLVETAKDMGLEDNMKDMSLWCDFYHNFNVHAADPNLNLTHTHCLGRGDKQCRFVIK